MTTALTAYAVMATAVVTLVTALFGAWKAYRAETISKANSRAIQEIHISINSRMDELLRLTASASHAEGVKEEKDKLS